MPRVARRSNAVLTAGLRGCGVCRRRCRRREHGHPGLVGDVRRRRARHVPPGHRRGMTHVLQLRIRLTDHVRVLLPFLVRLLPPGVLLDHLSIARGCHRRSRQMQLCKFNFGETGGRLSRGRIIICRVHTLCTFCKKSARNLWTKYKLLVYS